MYTRTQTIAIVLVLISVVAVPAAIAQQTTTGAGAGSAPVEAEDRADEEYTRLSVEVDDGYPELKPGENASVTVTVANHDEEAVTVDPSLEHPPRGSDVLPAEWLEYDADNLTVEPDEAVTFNVTVAVPENADLGRYHVAIAVTDERIQHPGQPPRPLHAARLGVNVYKGPTVHVLSRTHLNGQIEAGDATTAEIVVENTGDEAVPVNPEIGADDPHRRGPRSDATLDPAWVDVDAPGEIPAGVRATVEVTVSPPADAELGNHRTEIDLGLRDPARPEDDQHWQRVGVDVNVWSQPEEPYVRDFDVDSATDAVGLRLTQRGGHGSTVFGGDHEPGSFNVTLVSPDGERISPERVRLSDRGSVDLTRNRRTGPVDEAYSAGSAEREYVYRVEAPTTGEWTVEIEPQNTIRFDYEIVRE